MTVVARHVGTKAWKHEGTRQRRSVRSLYAQGEPMIWLTGGGLALATLMVAALLALVLYQGVATFWPVPVVHVRTPAGALMGEVTRGEFYPTEQGEAYRRLFRTGNYELTGTHFHWIPDAAVDEESRPPWALVIERRQDGRFYGEPTRFLIDGEEAAADAQAAWALFQEHFPGVVERRGQIHHIERKEKGRLNSREEAARLRVVDARLRHGEGSPRHQQAAADFQRVQEETAAEHARLTEQAAALATENRRFRMELTTAPGQVVVKDLDEMVRVYPANQLGFLDKVRVYFSRWWEFLSDEPRHANSEGGVFPAIFGTVLMTLLMSIAVVPFGVLAALYLREYAKAGPVVSAVRIAINNLAGVPSIVFGVFGLGFFAYIVGTSIDELFFQAKLADGGRPTFGTGGLLWASLTLALLTLPVVIVATEEALAAVPSSMRDGAYACGASKWQTIRRIVLPRAMPGVMTGMILAMARGAGEVAPLMLVGAVKSAPALPGRIDGVTPYFHIESSFMHLGFHIYDLGFQSQNAEAAKAMVYTTTLLLIGIVVLLNLTSMFVRNRLRRAYAGAQF